MMMLSLIVVAVFVASKWMGAQQQGKEEGGGIGFWKNDFSRSLLSISQKLDFHIMLASSVSLLNLVLA